MSRIVILLVFFVGLPSTFSCRDPVRPNVVPVVIDALRRDRLSGLGHHRPTSPHLDELMSRGVLFENLVSTSSQTVPAVASLLTGLYPSETSVQYYGKKSSFDGERPWSEAGPHFDASLSSLAERLRDGGYRTAERTLLVVVSDHGDEFAEHGGLGHGTTLYEELVGSFLLLHYPEKLAPKRISAETSVVDVAPTVLELTGLGPPAPASGESLLGWLDGDDSESRVIFSELGSLKSARRGDFKLVLDLEDGRRELYRLSADPAEKENVWGENEETGKDLARRLSRFVANARGPEGTGRQIDRELRERLRALGDVE